MPERLTNADLDGLMELCQRERASWAPIIEMNGGGPATDDETGLVEIEVSIAQVEALVEEVRRLASIEGRATELQAAYQLANCTGVRPERSALFWECIHSLFSAMGGEADHA